MVGKAIFDWCSIVTYENNVWLNIFITFWLLSIFFFFFWSVLYFLWWFSFIFFPISSFQFTFFKKSNQKENFSFRKKVWPTCVISECAAIKQQNNRSNTHGPWYFSSKIYFMLIRLLLLKKLKNNIRKNKTKIINST